MDANTDMFIGSITTMNSEIESLQNTSFIDVNMLIHNLNHRTSTNHVPFILDLFNAYRALRTECAAAFNLHWYCYRSCLYSQKKWILDFVSMWILIFIFYFCKSLEKCRYIDLLGLAEYFVSPENTPAHISKTHAVSFQFDPFVCFLCSLVFALDSSITWILMNHKNRTQSIHFIQMLLDRTNISH